MWPVLKGKVRPQPVQGKYNDWKVQVATDCSHACTYCSIAEAEYGGIDNFHIDHYRPKHHFPLLRDIITNLYLSCAICNRFKRDDWPADPDPAHAFPCYPDPSQTDYNELFQTETRTHALIGRFPAAEYLVERLYLNRPQLVRLRRVRSALIKTDGFSILAEEMLTQAATSTDAQLRQLADQMAQQVLVISRLLRRLAKLPPYLPGETKRVAAARPRRPAGKARRGRSGAGSGSGG